MMWFHGKVVKSKEKSQSYRDKMVEAIEYFREKYKYNGLIEVRVKEIEEFEPIIDVNVQIMNEILPNTFWIGVDEGDFRRDEDKGFKE